MFGGAALHVAIGLVDPRTRELVDADLMAGVGALIVVVEPASGGWLVLGIGVWTMWAVRRKAASGGQQAPQASRGMR